MITNGDIFYDSLGHAHHHDKFRASAAFGRWWLSHLIGPAMEAALSPGLDNGINFSSLFSAWMPRSYLPPCDHPIKRGLIF